MSVNTETAAPNVAPSIPINSEVPAIQLQLGADAEGAADRARADFSKARSEGRRATIADREALKAEILSKNLKARATEIADDQAKFEAGKTKPAAKTDEKGGEPKAVEAKAVEAKADEADTEAKADESKTDESKTEDKKPSRHVATIAKLNQENRDLKAKLATFEGKPSAETKADFIAKLKADPSIIFKEIDDPELLTKFAEARHRDLTPEEKLRAEFDAKLAERDKKAADAEQAAKEAQTKATDQQVYGGIAQILNHGLKGEDGETLIDNSKWPLCQRVTTAGEHDAPRMAMNILVALQKDLGRKPTDSETQQLLTIAFDQLESSLRKKADVYRLDAPKEEPPKTKTVQGAKDQRPKTLNNRMASGGRVPTNIKPNFTKMTKAEREAYKEQLHSEHVRRQRAAASV